MQRCILFVFFSLLSCGAGDGPNAGIDADLNQLSAVALNRNFDPSFQDTEEAGLTSEHDDHSEDWKNSEDASAVMAERDDLRAQLAQKDKEYIAQYRAAKKLRVLYQQEHLKNAQLDSLLQKALAKLRTFHHDFDNLARVRSMLDSAVDTAASLSLEGAEDPGLDSEIEQAMAMGGISAKRPSPASKSHRPASNKLLRQHHGKLGNHFRSAKAKTSSGAVAGDAPMVVPDAEGDMIASGHADPDRPAQQRAIQDELRLDSQMQEEDEQIQLLEQTNDEG